MKFVFYLNILSIVGIISCALMDNFPSQLVLLLFLITVFFITFSIMVKNNILKYIGITVFSLTFSLAVVEGYFYIALNKTDKVIQINEIKTNISKELLSTLNPNDTYTQVAARRIFCENEEIIYKTIYTRDSSKRRITPYAPNAKTAVVLLGCSFTFGDGIKDEETFAYRLGEILGKNYQVFNLGVGGSGPHKILAELENGLPFLNKYSKVIFYYTAMDDHLRRAAAIHFWDESGLLYTVQDNKAVRVEFPKNALPSHRNEYVMKWLTRSYLYKKISIPFESFFAKYGTFEKQLELQKALMSSMASTIAKDYPKSKFSVLLWPPRTESWANDTSLTSVDLREWLPSYEKDPKMIIQNDGHPSAYSNELVAKQLAKLVVKDAQSLD